MNRNKTIALCIVGCWLATGQANADYRISTIADSRGEFSAFGLPSVNLSGQIVYRADFDDLDAGSVILWERSSGRTVIASTGDDFLGFPADPGITDDGAVVFVADLDTGGRSVVRSYGGVPVTIAATEAPALIHIDPFITVNDIGVVSYSGLSAGLPLPVRSVFRWDGSTTTIAADNQPGIGTLEPFSFAADLGRSVWFQTTISGNPVIWQGEDDVFRFSGPITGTTGAAKSFADLALLSAGGVGQGLFWGELLSGTRGIFIVSPPIPNGDEYPTVVDDAGEFQDFDQAFMQSGSTSITTTVFRATLDAGGAGLYVREQDLFNRVPVAPTLTSNVISTGDRIGGSAVVELAIGSHPLNDEGLVVFWAHLADGTTGIYAAEPGGNGGSGGGGAVDPAVLVLLALAAAGGRNRR